MRVVRWSYCALAALAALAAVSVRLLEDEHKIGELPSTAICGNDITASCFYVRTHLVVGGSGVFSARNGEGWVCAAILEREPAKYSEEPRLSLLLT